MSNPFYDYNEPVVSGTTIRSDKYNTDHNSLVTSFDKVHAQFGRTVSLPSVFTGNNQIPEQTVTETLLYINASGDIDLYSIAAFNQKVATVNTQHSQIQAWQFEVADNVGLSNDALAKANLWAEAAEDNQVETGKYSAKHWAMKSEDHAQTAQSQVTLAQGHADDASTFASEAESDKDLAREYALKAENVPVSGTADEFSALHYSLRAKFWADNAAATVGNDLSDYVPKVTTVNGKPLSSNITLTLSDIGAAAAVHGHSIADVTGLQAALDTKLESADVSGKLDATSNAVSASVLETARSIGVTLVGDVTGTANANFDGSSNIDIEVTATVGDNSHSHQISDISGLQAELDSKVGDSDGYYAEVNNTSSTVSRQGEMTEIWCDATADVSKTISSTGWSDGDRVTIHKGKEAGRLDLNSADEMFEPDGNSAYNHFLPDGVSGSIHLIRIGSAWALGVN